jgi:chromosome segregation ATPase
MNESDKQLIKEAVYEVIEPFIARMAQDYEAIQQWMKRIEQRLDSLEQRVGSLEQRVGGLEQRVGGLEHQVASLERRLGRLEIELQEVKQRLESLEQRLAERGFVESEEIARERWATFADLRRLELRVTQLEAAVFQSQRPADGISGVE